MKNKSNKLIKQKYSNQVKEDLNQQWNLQNIIIIIIMKLKYKIFQS